MCVAGKVSDSGKVFCLSALELECVERKKDQAWLGSFFKLLIPKMPVCKSNILLPIEVSDIMASGANVIPDSCMDGLIDFWHLAIG